MLQCTVCTFYYELTMYIRIRSIIIYVYTCTPDNMIDLVFNVRCFSSEKKNTKTTGCFWRIKWWWEEWYREIRQSGYINAHKQCQNIAIVCIPNGTRKKIVSHQITTFPTGKLNFTRNICKKNTHTHFGHPVLYDTYKCKYIRKWEKLFEFILHFVCPQNDGVAVVVIRFVSRQARKKNISDSIHETFSIYSTAVYLFVYQFEFELEFAFLSFSLQVFKLFFFHVAVAIRNNCRSHILVWVLSKSL